MGYLITIEGGEYVGKTSVAIPAVLSFFKQAGYDAITSREPGGTPKGEAIRAEIFTKLKKGASQLQLAKLFNKARKIHINEIIKPYLGSLKEKKAVVILDRYLDSTRVYQGLEGGVDLKTIHDLEKRYVGSFFPDLTIILYFPEKIFEKTLVARMKGDLASRDYTEWDKSSTADHLKRQRKYLSLPKLAKKLHENRQFALIDASKSPKDVAKLCIDSCKALL
ncbi:dTMP kinase [Candidatus Roizmanbacteria bacterium RIFCSPHIGHO2_02_FULL_40_13b]|uniref:Thymidylate kinase n=1 Tax=Candidatus Roizmanbacteria bacterium RIFCSPHIGHO2_01_FULL_39_24 TaxID=1802032 RepID=A0A1F7GIG5_9BACT|nr:MAG: dTMP kinase [Candidatus Roizmanbacteria bacterium RIFCSPHIGHO2_01_FULL_39_24]OGK26502.1 MAG: dTMP kinase [Candidatus Roizmanbacteria bacterium RIFCSPHIGHO2_02_FULL_40_13b]OGK50352.1 MAG: dTMP kinase [Candidatus Roizmanbacteria bacterium RIFCSPLOWO2_01_FULL_40_32]OGK56197.1 MAG: dTMP kinase [Candidatus Roizmanbacteria bacterium RIFCSPLOWO2_02_FULL_39_8]